MSRDVPRTAAAIFALLVPLALTTGPARADDEPPTEPPVLIAKDDHFKMYAGVALYRLEVYDNDPGREYDRVGTHGQLDRAPDVSRREVHVQSNVIILKLDPKRTKDVVFRYRLVQVETGVLSNWATVTIEITKNLPPRFRALGDGRLKVTNRNAARAKCIWWKAGDWRALGQGSIKGKGSRVLKLKVPAIDINCEVGKKYRAVIVDRRVKVRL